MNPDHLTVLKGLIKSNMGNVMEYLALDVSDFQKGFDIANEMQNLNYVKLLYSNYNKNQVIVEITLWGESEAQKNL